MKINVIVLGLDRGMLPQYGSQLRSSYVVESEPTSDSAPKKHQVTMLTVKNGGRAKTRFQVVGE